MYWTNFWDNSDTRTFANVHSNEIHNYITICLLSCGQKSNDSNFSSFLNAIPNQSLPLDLSCGLPNNTNSVDEFQIFKQFLPKSTDMVFGRIGNNNENYQLVIFGKAGDDIYPVLFSFDKQGNIMDSLSLILKGCGAADEHQIPHSFVSISTDLLITLTDTTRLIHFPDNKSSEYVMDSLRVSRVVIRLGKDGKFEKQ